MQETCFSLGQVAGLLGASSAVSIALIYLAFLIAITIDCWRFKGDFTPFPSTIAERKRLAWGGWVLFLCVAIAALTYVQ